MSGKGSARLFTGWLIELYHYTKNANRHMPLSCAFAPREAHQAASREALRRGVEPLPLLHEVAEGARLHRARRSPTSRALADDAGAVELHAPGRAPRHPRLLDLLGRARGDDHRPQNLQPVLREVRRSSTASRRRPSRPSTRTSISTCSTSTRICSTRSSRTCRRCRPSARRACSTTATSSSSTSGCGPTTSRSTTRSTSNPVPRTPVRRAPRLKGMTMTTTATPRPATDLPLLKRSATVAEAERPRRHPPPARRGHPRGRRRRSCFAKMQPRSSTAPPRSTRSPRSSSEKPAAAARARRAAREGGRRDLPVAPETTARSMTGHRVLRAPPRALRRTGSSPSTPTRSGRRSSPARRRRAQVLGFAFEKYHYIEAAFEHMGIAAANATPEMMPHLARHFIEEYTHGDIYRKGLRSLFPDDVDPALAAAPVDARARELPDRVGAAQLVRLLRGQRAPADDREHGRREGGRARSTTSTRRCASTTPTPTSLSTRSSRTPRPTRSSGTPTPSAHVQGRPPADARARSNDALNVAKNMAEHLLLFMDGIDTFYGKFPTVPRLPCDPLSE